MANYDAMVAVVLNETPKQRAKRMAPAIKAAVSPESIAKRVATRRARGGYSDERHIQHARAIAKSGGMANGKKRSAEVSDYVYVLRRRFSNYKVHTKREWQLTEAQFEAIVTKPCWYCGGGPSATWTGRKRSGATPVFNGIDRVDNAVGYVPVNVVPCCGPCNRAKHTQDVDKFLEMVRRIYERHCVDDPVAKFVL